MARFLEFKAYSNKIPNQIVVTCRFLSSLWFEFTAVDTTETMAKTTDEVA
jgi:hypothetical protein